MSQTDSIPDVVFSHRDLLTKYSTMTRLKDDGLMFTDERSFYKLWLIFKKKFTKELTSGIVELLVSIRQRDCIN